MKHSKKQTRYIIAICAMLSLVGCTTKNSEEDSESNASATNVSSTSSIITYSDYDYDEDYSDEDAETITLSDSGITYDGSHATVSQNTIAITTAGTFIVSGTSSDAQIVVDATKNDHIRIVLDNTNISCKTSSPIYVKQADKVVLTLAPDSKNTISDTANYTFASTEEDEPDAAIFAKDDLTINGSGSLSVTANYKTGIKCKNDLKIMNGTIRVTSVDNGIIGKDTLAIKNGTVNITSTGDGLKSNNATETDKGILCIEGGDISINAQQDGIQSDNMLYIYDGVIKIISGGGSANAPERTNTDEFARNPFGGQSTTTEDDDTASMKGMKSTNSMAIFGGTFTLDCVDDTLHSNNTITIDGGTFDLTTSDDGIHADTQLDINKGTIIIQNSYEGLEASTININDGTIHLKASDDGINAATSTSTSSGMPGQGGDESQLNINGGYVYVDADGDGLDSNGTIAMHQGTVIINGPTSNNDAALDFDGEFTIDGGTFIASGSSGMAQTPTTIENGYCLAIGLNTSSTSIVHIQDSDGTGVLTFEPSKNSQSVIYYSNSLSKDKTYVIYTGGSASDNNGDGIYDSSTYKNGTQYQEVTISDRLTSIGNIQTGGMGGMSPGGKGGMGGNRGGTPPDMNEGETPPNMENGGTAPNSSDVANGNV